MLVSELIEELKRFPADAFVVGAKRDQLRHVVGAVRRFETLAGSPVVELLPSFSEAILDPPPDPVEVACMTYHDSWDVWSEEVRELLRVKMAESLEAAKDAGL